MISLDTDILLRFMRNECTSEDLQKINEEIAETPEYANELFRLEELYHLGKADKRVSQKSIEKAENRLMRRIHAEEKKQFKFVRLQKIMRYAAVIALLVIGAGVSTWLVNSALTANYQTARAINDVRKITLSDGTKVWLNTGSSLTFANDFSHDKYRKVKLSGEAYFEVTKNRHKPFIVNTNSLRVKVLGTVFNCKSVKDTKSSEVSLIEGKVEVKSKNHPGLVVLSPGQKAELNLVSGNLSVKQIDTKMDAVWHNGLIPFKNATIVYITKVLERFYNVKIILSPELNVNSTYSGVLKKKDQIDDVLLSLQNSIPIKFRKVKDRIFVENK